MPQTDLYKPQFVKTLFDEMAKTYGVVNMISSLGFAHTWRRQCVNAIQVPPGSIVLDLMAGMGETSRDIVRQTGRRGTIFSLDISHTMCNMAAQNGNLSRVVCPCQVVEADALACPFPDNSFDAVTSVFGLKTFSGIQTEVLASEVHRVLKPGGKFSFLEISIPPSRLLRLPYVFYLRYIIPLIGRLLMGNPDNYRLLYVYTQAFGNCREAQSKFNRAGLIAEYRSCFFGCATIICGTKPRLTKDMPTPPRRGLWPSG